MPQFMLLIRGGDEPGLSAEQRREIVNQYIAWARKLQAEGRMHGGDELADGGKTLVASGGAVRVVDGPYTETKEAVGGYFLVEADDLSHAVELTRGCPRLARSGSVEVRAIVDHSGS